MHAQEISNSLFSTDARGTWRARTHMLFHALAIRWRQLAVDVWRDERVERPALRHGPRAGVEAG